MLRRFVELVQGFATGLGGPGLFLVTLLDSSFLSFPEVPDFLLIWLVIQHPWRWIYYAFLATAGSVAGCYALYVAARKSGQVMTQRFHARTTERALGAIRRFGVLAIIVPAILPPPLPFKIFVILAGVSEIPTRSFLIAIVFGRGFRYLVEALLAYRYGEAAIQYVQENIGRISIWMAITVAIVGAAIVIWRRRTRHA